MAFKENLRAVWSAWRQHSPVITDAPPAIREVLLRRYLAMSFVNARIAPIPYLLIALSIGDELPLWPRLLMCAVLTATWLGREWRGRRWLRLMDAGHLEPDRLYGLLVVAGTACWGIGPLLMRLGNVSDANLLVAVCVGLLAIALTSVGYISALPACFAMVPASVAPIVVCLALQGTQQAMVLAAGSLVCGGMLLQRIAAAHEALLDALSAQAQNALLVQELEIYRAALERENASLGSSLRDASHAASRDALTNLYNRRYLSAFGEPLAEAVRDHREEVTLCMVDVDHFKRINDTHGHPIGDEVLKFVAVLLGARLRDFDCLARYGGEEFAVVLRRCDIARGRRVAEALRHNVAGAEIDTEVGTVAITVSVGVAQWAPGEALDDVIQRADRALYRAKQTGRDRVEIDANDVLRGLAPGGDPTFPANLH